MVAVAVAVVVGAAVVGTGVVEPPETVTAPFWKGCPDLRATGIGQQDAAEGECG